MNLLKVYSDIINDLAATGGRDYKKAVLQIVKQGGASGVNKFDLFSECEGAFEALNISDDDIINLD